MLADDRFLDDLADRLTPVRPRSAARDFLVLGALAVVEVMLYVAVRGMRPDMASAMGRMDFWWKAISLLGLAVVAVVTAVAALDPARSPRFGLRVFGIAATAALALGWALDAAHAGSAHLAARLAWREGLSCVGAVVFLSVPPLVALAWLMRRGAPTDPEGAASAAGLAAAAWGGAVFTMACPHDDPLYVAVWFAVAIVLIMSFARIVLPRLTRW